MYPAVIGEWAELLPSDEGEVALIRPLLAATAIENVPLRLAYDADRDGWTAEAFHDKVNTFGAAVVIAETVGGAVLGGYNPSGALHAPFHRTTAAMCALWLTRRCDLTVGRLCGGLTRRAADAAVDGHCVARCAGWISLGEDRNSLAAFLFTWPDGNTSKRPLKVPKVGGAGMAVMDKADQGPLFAPDGLRIPLSPQDPKLVRALMRA